MTTEEDALEIVLWITTASCVGLAIVCLLIASAIRVTIIQSRLDHALRPILADLQQDLVVAASGNSGSTPKNRVKVKIVPSSRRHSTTTTTTNWLRRLFLAWCDVDYILMVSIDSENDNYDDLINMDSETGSCSEATTSHDGYDRF